MMCNDPKCPFHGHLKVRGIVLEGIVTSAKPEKTVTVKIPHIVKVPKFERYKRVTYKIHAYNPICINAAEGDFVRVGETRKLSKTKSFVVIAKLKNHEKVKNR